MMGKHTGFLEYPRQPLPERPAALRLNDFYEIYVAHDEDELRRQGARCMDCGVPFCQADPGCPIDNLIPEWNDLVRRGLWRDAYERLAETNNFPEFTGRICPAPCEDACVLGITDPPVAIKSIEQAIADRAFAEGWVRPRPPVARTGRRVAVVGSGPAGLAAADQLNRAGHSVTVFERDDRIGGLLTYGVPNMKLDKSIVQRRVDLLAAEGIEFVVNANIGVDIPAENLRRDFDAVLLACGALRHRELDLPGRGLDGVHMAMDYLHGVTERMLEPARASRADRCGAPASSATASGPRPSPVPLSGATPLRGESGLEALRRPRRPLIDARGKRVVVIGGGDTGADCIATALRQGCAGLLNITRRDREPDSRDDGHPWPGPAGTYYLDYAHVEGQAATGRDPREYGVLPLEYVGDDAGRVAGVRIERLAWETGGDGRPAARRTGVVETVPADLVLLAVGFTGHDAPNVVAQLGVRSVGGLVPAEYGVYATDVEGVFAAGDMRRGASLIVWAIAEGRGAAARIDAYLDSHRAGAGSHAARGRGAVRRVGAAGDR